MRLGIGSYTYNWWVGVPGFPQPANPLTVCQLLDLAASLDVSVVQIADNLPLEALSDPALDELEARARALHLAIETGTRGIRPEVLRRHLAIARRLGARTVRTLLEGCAPGEAIRLLREAAPEFEQAGVTLAIENHDSLCAPELRRIVEQAASPAVGVCLDTANSLGCGEGLPMVLDSLAHLVVNLHVKDFTARRLAHGKGFVIEGAPAGKGLVDIPALLQRLAGAGRDPHCILELWTPPEATLAATIEKEREWAGRSLRYLRTLLPTGRQSPPDSPPVCTGL